MDGTRDNRQLWHEDIGQGDAPPLLLLHGWGCDASFLEAQAGHFARSRRVVSVDLPGHGRSAAVGDPTSIAGMSAAVADLCDTIGLTGAVVAGHSMGGSVALDLAHRRPAMVSALILVDVVIFPAAAFRQAVVDFAGLLATGDMHASAAQACAVLFLPVDDPRVAERFRASLLRTPAAVVTRAFSASLLDYDPTEALAGFRKPIAYIGAERPAGDVGQIASVCPQVKVGQVLGAGHFAPVLVPDQVNAMMAGFLAAYADGP